MNRNTLADALTVADGLEAASEACSREQTALGLRLLQGAHVIRELHGMVITMHREHATNLRERDARKQAQNIAARERVREYEEGDWS